MSKSKILILDALINLILGILLLLFSPVMIAVLGLPGCDHYFYPNLLGAVLFGIGIALLIECFRKDTSFVGLGLAGAVSINLAGATALGYWLLFKSLSIPAKGKILLWAVAIIVYGTSAIELVHLWKKSYQKQNTI